ncbi:MAG: protein Tex, partial [Micromonosporaceae bacterium]|nr:protein Tex [Micromonosporaceae bacterium]
SKTFVKNPRDVVKPGDIVRAKVLTVDIPRKRISLTLRLDDEAVPDDGGDDTSPARGAGGDRGAGGAGGDRGAGGAGGARGGGARGAGARDAGARGAGAPRGAGPRGAGGTADTALAEALRRAGLTGDAG